MPFKKFKEKHGGNGPFEEAYSAMTGGQGFFGRKGMKDERELTDQLIADVTSNPEFAGLEGLAEAGRSPLTREQHASFRAGLLQSALDTRVANAGYDDYVKQSASMRASANTPDDIAQLDNFDSQMRYARDLAASGDPQTRQQGMSLMGQIFSANREYLRANEITNLQLKESETAGREIIRKELQQQLDTQILNPVREDTANYRAIRAQLDGAGDAVAPNAITSAVLTYTLAEQRGAGEGNWSFQMGPLGISDANLPPMTFSQLRDRLDKAYEARDSFMRSEGEAMMAQAQKQGFGVNGTRVSDLRYPLADRVYESRETVSAPPPPTPESVQAGAEKVGETVTNAVAGAGRGLFPNVVAGATDLLEFISPFDEPDAEPARLPVNGDVREENNSRPDFSRNWQRRRASGVIQR